MSDLEIGDRTSSSFFFCTMYFVVLISCCRYIRRWFHLLRGLLMQYRDCHLILTNDPLHVDCILRLASSDDDKTRRAAAVQSLGRARTFVLAATFRRAEVTDALYRRSNVHRRILSGRRITGNVCRKPHTDLTTARACNVIATRIAALDVCG